MTATVTMNVTSSLGLQLKVAQREASSERDRDRGASGQSPLLVRRRRLWSPSPNTVTDIHIPRDLYTQAFILQSLSHGH